MTPALSKSLQRLRAAETDSAFASAKECFGEALQEFAERCRREAIRRCVEIARQRRAVAVVDELEALIDQRQSHAGTFDGES